MVVLFTSPAIYDSVPAGEPQSLTVVFSIPKGTPLVTLRASILLEAPGRIIEPPFRMTVETKRATATEIPPDIALPSPDRIVTSPQSDQVIFVKDEIDIYFQTGVTQSAVTALVSQIGGVILGSIGEINFYQVQVLQEGFDNITELITTVEQSPDVKFATYHLFASLTADPYDPGSEGSYVLPLLKLPEAWDLTTGEKRVGLLNEELNIGVIDTAFDVNHPDLRDNVTKLWNFTSFDDTDHGTRVASIIGARGNNGIGITGVMWRASLHVYGAGMIDQAGETVISGAAVEKAVTQIIKEKVRVVNMSFASECNTNNCADHEIQALLKADEFYRNQIDRAQQAGVDILWVCSAGNNGINTAFASPSRLAADYPNVVSVSAVNSQKERAKFAFGLAGSSNYGQLVTVAAPGVNVPSLKPGEGEDNSFDGTSAATPYGAGVAGLMLSVSPHLTAAHLKEIIRHTAEGTGNLDPAGNEIRLLNAFGAVREAQFLPFVEGYPGIPGDGIIINAAGGEIDNDFNPSPGFPLAGATEGFTFTVFLPSSVPLDNLRLILPMTYSSNPCSRPYISSLGSPLLPSGRVSYNGVEGVFFNAPQSVLQSLLNSWNQRLPATCQLTLKDLYYGRLSLQTGQPSDPFITTLDALAVRPRQNAFVGTRIQ
jgi:hypothetical protein